MAGADDLWNAQANSQNVEGAQRLSRMVAGNDHLVTEPGLVLALFNNNATPEQASALNQFVGGLHAETMVRTAGAAGARINLTDAQQADLAAMGIDYSAVQFTQKDAVSSLTDQMAAQGKRPVFDASGNVQTDAAGNPLTQPAKKKSDGGGGFWSGVGDFFGGVGNFFSDAFHGKVPFLSPPDAVRRDIGGPDTSLSGVINDLQTGYTYGSALLGDSNPARPGYFDASLQNSELAKQLGYDPNSFWSMQAFKAKGLQHNDTSKAAANWDNANPSGLFGWDGPTAATEAEVYSADPKKYLDTIASDKSLTPQQTAAKLNAVSSPQFQEMVQRVSADRSDIGAEVATKLGIDPLDPSFHQVAAGTNFVAMVLTDPLAVGLNAYRATQVASVSIKGLHDAAGITRIFKPEAGARVTIANQRAINDLHDVVQQTIALGRAQEAGNTVEAARINGNLQASNRLAGLASDFLGHDQILGVKSEAEIAKLGKGELPFVTGKGPAIDTYDKAVEYLASKSAMLRLQGGYAPIETSVMPGAMSSYGFRKVKGLITGWSAGLTAARTERDAQNLIARASADPDKYKPLFDKNLLTRSMPSETDAVDVLTGKVIAAQKATDEAKTFGEFAQANSGLVSARRALEERQSAREGAVDITGEGYGYLADSRRRYGLAEPPSSLTGKIASIYTLGAAQRAKVIVTRLFNQLPARNIDIESAASADTVRRFARTWMTSGDASMLQVRWITGDADTRKAIVAGMKDQIAHASGLTRTEAGQKMVSEWHAQTEAYATSGREFLDSNGVPSAQWAGQVQTKFSLPDFGAVHQAAAKIGLYEGTMGRLLTRSAVDKLMTQWKLDVLFTPVTALRGNIESWINAHFNGLFKDGVQAKAILRDAGKMDGQGIARSKPADRILTFAPLQGAGQFYRHVVQADMEPQMAREIANLPEDLQAAYMQEQAASHYAMSISPGGADQAEEIARQGFRPVKASYDSKKGFTEAIRIKKGYELTEEVDGVAGANLFAHALALRVNKAPKVAKAIIDRVENPELTSDHVVAALDAERLIGHTLYGKVFIRPDGTQAKAVTADDIAVGKQQFAEQVTKEFRDLVTGRNAVVQKDITDYVKANGHAPDADWILEHVKGQNRPAALLRPVFDAAPAESDRLRDKLGVIVDNFQQAEGRGYQWLVERLIQRHSTTPLFAAAYGHAKVGLEDFKQSLIRDSGLSEVAAERATANIAAEQAWSRVARMVDDPHMKMQMDVVGRSFFAFSRATTMMLRRWGTTLWRNPAMARRYQLSAEAAVHSGLIYTDPSTGDWMFHFPASGVAQEVLMHAMSNVPGLEGLAQFPTSDFTGRVASIIPGSSNPFQYNTNPMVSISGRWIASRFPEYRQWFDEVDQKLNGSAGQGQGFFAAIMPNLAKKLYDTDVVPVFGKDGRDAIITSAMVGSLYNLYAAGMVPPDGASPSEMDSFYGRLKTQTKSQLFLRAVLGAFSPATVSTPDNENPASRPDAAFAALGAQGLRDEFKILINATGGDFARATAIWTQMHPDLTVYTTSGSQSTTSRANMPATQAALNWMNGHLDFISKYKTVAAFFIPQQSAGDPYSQAAYRAQLEEGLRQRKTPQEFLDGARVSAAAGVYYPMEQKYQADLAAAKAAGNTQLAAQHRADWAAWSKQFKALHPTFLAHVEASSANVVAAKGQIDDLRLMVNNGEVPNGLAPAVSGMLQAYEGFRQFVHDNPAQTAQGGADRSAAFQQLQDYMTQLVAAVPDVGDLYSGVFRVLNHNLDQIN